MALDLLLIIPPFTQLNTPYPATSYLKGFLESQGQPMEQMDLSIELFNAIFSRSFLQKMFDSVEPQADMAFPEVWEQRAAYTAKVDRVVGYLRKQEVTAAYQLTHPGFLPISHREEDSEETEWAFGSLGILDHAKHLATLFIEELGDFIQAHVDEFFSFTRYAEQIARAAGDFTPIDAYLQYEPTLIEIEMLRLLKAKLSATKPDLVGFTVPFPGNLFSTLRCAQYIKRKFPKTKVAMGGGYCNTELRSLSDPGIFKYIDFITLDDGEVPLLRLCQLLDGKIQQDQLERTFLLKKGKVVYQDKIPNTIFHHRDLPAPTYIGLPNDRYLSFLDVMNPMHRLWTDGRWNKLTVSHGCYWKQCSFCDVSLDYIGNYQNTTADKLVDKIETLVAETGITGFHFVDEAAPPKMLRALAETLIRREVYITWWTNIRFEKTFTPELCQLLSLSGCIAVTGGLEVASDRLLERMKKGVDIAQVARVTHAFAEQGIMVHAYLMYGFPTQTAQETIDSLEVVRQLFENGCIHSAFWHLFTATAHSPVGLDPESFEIRITGPDFKGFAQNDLEHEDPTGCDHTAFGPGLKLALNHYLKGEGLDLELQEWFEMEVPETGHPGDLIAGFLGVGQNSL